MYIYYLYLSKSFTIVSFFIKLWLPSGFSKFCEKDRDKANRF